MKKKKSFQQPEGEDSEFLSFLHKYEAMMDAGKKEFFDVDILADILAYYSENFMDDEAHKCAEFLLTLYPDNTDALVFLARESLWNGKTIEAKKIERRISDKSDTEVKFLRAEILLSDGKKEEATAFFEENFSNKDVDDCFDIATIYRDNELYKESIDWLNKIFTTDEEALYRNNQLRADCLIMLDKATEAEPILDALIDKNPYDAFSWELMAQAQIAEDKYSDAIESCDFALAVNPEETMASKLKAMCFFKLENYTKALEIFLSLKDEKGDEDDKLYLQIAISFEEINDLSNTIKWLEKAKAVLIAKQCRPVNTIKEKQISEEDARLLTSILLHLAECYSDDGNQAESEKNIVLSDGYSVDKSPYFSVCGILKLRNGNYMDGMTLIRKAINVEDAKASDMLDMMETLNKMDFLPIAQQELIPEIKARFPEMETKLYAHEAFIALYQGDEDDFVSKIKKALWFDFAYTREVFSSLVKFDKASEMMEKARSFYREKAVYINEMKTFSDGKA